MGGWGTGKQFIKKIWTGMRKLLQVYCKHACISSTLLGDSERAIMAEIFQGESLGAAHDACITILQGTGQSCTGLDLSNEINVTRKKGRGTLFISNQRPPLSSLPCFIIHSLLVSSPPGV